MQNAAHRVQRASRQRSKTLLAGWFSFEARGATAGDLLAADLACEWLERASCSYDIALAPPFRGGVDWRSVDPQSYSNVVFVCGPLRENYEPVPELLSRFADCYKIGLNLSMLTPLDIWNPFDFLLERDSSVEARPDVVFLSRQARVPVVGVVLVEPYEAGETQIANAAIHRLVTSREMSVVTIDTRLDVNSTGLRSSAEIESLIARMDVVVTTRLHGMVLALKNGIPVVAIDSEQGGAKIRRQAETIGWPVVFNIDDLTDERLQEAFKYCLTEDARVKVRECSERAMDTVEEVRDQFIAALSRPGASQRTGLVHGGRWLQEQWQGTNFEAYNFLQIWKLKNALTRERRKVQRLTQKLQDVRDLRKNDLARERRKVQRVTQQLQDMRDLGNSGTQRLMRKLDHILVKVLRK
jgi:polysaccharide pyruvyl transferase